MRRNSSVIQNLPFSKSHQNSPTRANKQDGPVTQKLNGNGAQNVVKHAGGTLSQRLDKMGQDMTSEFVNAICGFNRDAGKHHSDSRASIRSTFSGSINSKLVPTQPSKSKPSVGKSRFPEDLFQACGVFMHLTGLAEPQVFGRLLIAMHF